MDNSQELLGEEPIGKLLVQYSVPAIIGMMVNGLYTIVDRMFIGNIPNVGPMAITGLGITMPITTIIIAFGTLVGVGSATNISIKLGEKKREKAEEILGNALSLSVILGVLITIFGLIFLDKILVLFGANNNTIPYAEAYMNVMLVGTVFSIMSMMFGNLIRGDGSPRLSATMMVIGAALNIILDIIFIVILKVGIKGAGYATVTSQLVTTIIGLLYYLRGKSNVKLKKANLKLNRSTILTIFAIGMSPFAMQLANSMVQLIFNTSLKKYGGELAIGAMATIASINMLFVMPAFGFVQGMQPIVGYNYGAKKYNRVKKTLKLSMILAMTVFIIGSLVIQYEPRLLVGLFNNDKELMAITINGLKKYSLGMSVIGITIVGSNFIQSIGKAKVAMLLSLLRQVIILIPMVLILPNFLGLDGVWYAQPVANILSAIITAIVLFIELKKYLVEDDKKVKGKTVKDKIAV